MSYKFTKGSQVIGDLKAADDTQRDTLIDFGEDQIEFQTSGSTRLKVDNQGVEITGSIAVATGGTIGIGVSSINQTKLDRVRLAENTNSNGDTFLLIDSDVGFSIEDSDNSSASMVFSNPNVSNNASLKIRKAFSNQDSIQLHASNGLSLDGGSTFITSAEINVLDSVTAGTAAASKALVADSSINITGVNTGSFGEIITSKLSSSSNSIEFETGGLTRLKIENNEIVTTVPIHISGSLTEGLRIAKGGSDYREIQFETDGVDTAFIQVDSSEGMIIGCQSNGDEIIFMTTDGDGIAERMRIQANGRVGIGETNPSEALHVSGNVQITDAASFEDYALAELSIPGLDLQTDTNAFRFNCPYDLDIEGLQLYLDQHTTSGNVTVTATNTTDTNTMITLSITGTGLSASTTSVSNASCDAGDIITFAITATPANAQGLRANLQFRRRL